MAQPGRPLLEHSRMCRLTEVRLTKEEQRMIKLKARVFGKGTVSDYIRNLVDNDKRPYLPPTNFCYKCNNKDIQLYMGGDNFHYNITGLLMELKIINIPYGKCNSCGLVVADGALLAEIEEYVGDIVHRKLNSRKEIPGEIDFEDLLSSVPL